MNQALLLWRKAGLWAVLLFLVIVFSIAVPGGRFLDFNNVMNILRQASILGIAAVGVTFVMISGSVDLSVGSIVALIGVVCATLLYMGLHPVAVVIIGIVIGVVTSGLNGVLSVALKISHFIITLAAMSIWTGLAFIISGGRTIFQIPREFSALSQTFIFGGVPLLAIYFLVFIIIGAIILNKTYFGRYVYALGGNSEAARLSGININKHRIYVHLLCGVFFGVAGVLLLSRTMVASGAAATTYAFDIITAACLGGISIKGGAGKISGTVLGIVVLGVLFNGLTLLVISDFTQEIIKGLILLFAVTIDMLQREVKVGANEKVKAA